MPLSEHHEAVRHDSDNDGRHAIEDVRREADQIAKARAAAIFGEINARANSKRNAESAGDKQNINRSPNGVGHAAAGFARRFWNLGQESPVDRANPLVDQIAEDRSQRQQHKYHGASSREGDEEVETAPPDADRSTGKIGRKHYSFRHGSSLVYRGSPSKPGTAPECSQ